MAKLIIAKIATLRELQEIYDSRDYYDMLEAIAVDAHNHNAMIEANNG